MSAVILLQEMMLRKKLDPSSADFDDDLPVPVKEGEHKRENQDKIAVLAIAYHNMGVEQEFMKSYPAAILSYKKAVNFAEKHLGLEDGITQNLRNVYENAKNELDMALFKKTGKKSGKGKKRTEISQMGRNQQLGEMMTPRNEQQNMERVEEDQEEDANAQ
jgi:hypothetical protein